MLTRRILGIIFFVVGFFLFLRYCCSSYLLYMVVCVVFPFSRSLVLVLVLLLALAVREF